uniref:Uncharacterized protein n=1 Tax=Strigamia maritima TaxID=126957 RepID=T1IMN9_STRMM
MNHNSHEMGVNRRNLHYWNDSNPRWLRAFSHQVQWRINIWCDIWKDQLIGPVIYNDKMSGAHYQTIILQDVIEPFVDNLLLATRQRVDTSTMERPDRVYATPPATQNKLVNRITTECARIPVGVLTAAVGVTV